jgi:hypothetical protein
MPERVVRIIRWALGCVAAAISLASIMSWMTDSNVIGLWLGIPCLVFSSYLAFRWLRRKWLVHRLIKDSREYSNR